ncbi:hypothetical protein JCM19037_1411 [Geomicrobium sp. JCM 19037]|nr:hypothetical protein JCM19037_1411 [Geomicrobium sp. JCM 19037]
MRPRCADRLPNRASSNMHASAMRCSVACSSSFPVNSTNSSADRYIASPFQRINKISLFHRGVAFDSFFFCLISELSNRHRFNLVFSISSTLGSESVSSTPSNQLRLTINCLTTFTTDPADAAFAVYPINRAYEGDVATTTPSSPQATGIPAGKSSPASTSHVGFPVMLIITLSPSLRSLVETNSGTSPSCAARTLTSSAGSCHFVKHIRRCFCTSP